MGPRPPAMQRPTWPQKLSTSMYCFFLFVFTGCNMLMLLTPWTRIIWLCWVLYINWGPGKHASKRASWPKLLRKWRYWDHMAAYFPAKLHKAADLDPQERYVFVVHPHGIGTLYAWPCFDTDACRFSEKYPGIDVHPMTLEVNFKVPFVREWLLLHGVADASKQACLHILGKGPGQSILLAVGGAQEALLARPGTFDVILNKRKGFVKIALQTGARLVPVLGFGENDVVLAKPHAPGSFLQRASAFTKTVFGFTLPAFEGLGLFTSKGLMPFPLPLNVVVGPPVVFDIARCEGGEQVDSLDKMVDSYHAQYVEAMRKLYSEHAPKYTPGVALNIVE